VSDIIGQVRPERVSPVAFFVQGLVSSTAAVLALGAVNYLVRRKLAVELPRTEFAFYYSSLSLAMLCVTLVDGGLGPALAALLPRWQGKHTGPARVLVSTLFAIWLLLASAAGAVLFVAAPAIAQAIHLPGHAHVVRLFGLGLPAMVLFLDVMEVLRAAGDFSGRSWFLVVQVALFYMSMLACGVAHDEIVVLELAASNAATLALAALYAAGRHPELRPACRFSPRLARRGWRIGRWYFLLGAGLAVYNAGDVLVLARVAGLEPAGLYAVASSVYQLCCSPLLLVPMVFLPLAARLWTQPDAPGLRHLYEVVRDGTMLTCGLLVLVTLGAGDTIIGVLFDPAFAPAATALTLLVASLFFLVMALVHLNLLGVTGKPRRVVPALVAGMLVVLAGSAIGGHALGAAGAALSKLAAAVAMFAVSRAELPEVLKSADTPSDRAGRVVLTLGALAAALAVWRAAFPSAVFRTAGAGVACLAFGCANASSILRVAREIRAR
jgi:O-antigen/teichoic acid export membrane protein